MAWRPGQVPSEDTVVPSNSQPSFRGAGSGPGDVESYRKLIEQASDGILVVDGQGICLEINEAGALLLGMAQGEIAGLRLSDFVAPEELARFNVDFDKVRAGKALVLERILRRKDGSTFPVEVSAKRLSDGRIEGILRDITGRKQTEGRLRQSEERFRVLTAAAFEGIVISEHGRIVDVNDQFALMYRTDRASLVGCEVISLVAPESRDVVADRIKHEIEEPYEHRALRRDGTVFDIEVRAKAVTWDGRRVRVTAVLDVTERKRAEAVLRESQARLSLVFENAYDPLALYGVEEAGGYRLLMINPAFLRTASQRVGQTLTAGELLGRSYEYLVRKVLLLDERAIAASREHLDEAARTGKVVRWEETQQRATGQISSERIDIPVYDGQGRCGHVLRVVHDVTERKRAEGERAALLERVRSQSDALLKFSLDPVVTAGDVPAAARQITEMATRVTGAERASIWLFEPDAVTIHCVDRYDRIAGLHTADTTIDLSKYPAALAVLTNGRTVVLDDVELDPGMSPLLRDVPQAENTGSALATAIRVGGRVIGAAWIATVGRLKKWRPDEIAFGGAVGDHMAQAILNAEREQSTRSLHELAGQLMQAQDEERRRIGRDLHDSTGQLLAVLEINMAMLSRTAVGLDAKAQALLQDCIAQTKQCANSIRTASYLLHPPLLDEMGLVSAIQWQLDGFRRRSGIPVEAELPAGFVRLPAEDELSLFRVLQEALTNAHRHAGSTWVRVGLEQPPGAVLLTVSDNGKGFHPAALALSRDGGSRLGVGLAGMRERLRQLGGQLEIESDSTGTVLRASVPSRQRVTGASRPPGGAP